MDMFIKVYLNLIVLSFFTGLAVTAFRKKKGKEKLVIETSSSNSRENVTSLQNNMEFFGSVDMDRVQNIVDVSADDETEYDVPVIYAVVDVPDTADQSRAV